MRNFLRWWRELLLWRRKRKQEHLSSLSSSDPRSRIVEGQRSAAISQSLEASKFNEKAKRDKREIDALRTYIKSLNHFGEK